MPIQLSGSLVITGSITTTGGITISGSILSASYAATSSFSNNFTVLGNLTVFGTQSIQYITSSQLNVANNVITVNVASPGVRFGGLSVFDSGSQSSSATASLFWDSQNNNWIYQRETGSTYSGGMLISGPRNTSGIGNEQGTTSGSLMKGQGGDHVTSSAIFEDGYKATFYNTSLVVSSSGNVGIGTISNLAAWSGAARGLEIYGGAGQYATLRLNSADTGNFYLHSGVSQYWIYGEGNYPMTFYTSGSERMRITNSGSIGIGTTNPGSKLTVIGVDGGDTVPATYGGTIKIVDYGVNGPQAVGGLEFRDSNGYGSKIYTNSANDYLGFASRLGSATWTEHVVIKQATGNVGIGLNNPTDTDGYGGKVLDVNGPGYFRDNSDNTKYVSIGSVSSIGFIEANGTNNYLRFYTGGTGEKMRITSTGYIRTSNDGSYYYSSNPFHTIENTAADNACLFVSKHASTPYGIAVKYSAASPNNSGNDFYYAVDSSQARFRVASNGAIYSTNTSVQSISSDINLKTDIRNYDKGLAEVLAMKPRYFKYKTDLNVENAGFIAQEMDEALPGSMIDTNLDNGDVVKTYHMDWNPILVKAIQELEARVKELETK